MSLLQEFYKKDKIRRAIKKIEKTSTSQELVKAFEEVISLIIEPQKEENHKEISSIVNKINEIVGFIGEQNINKNDLKSVKNDVVEIISEYKNRRKYNK